MTPPGSLPESCGVPPGQPGGNPPGRFARVEGWSLLGLVAVAAFLAAGLGRALPAGCLVWFGILSFVMAPGYLVLRLSGAWEPSDWLDTFTGSAAAGFVLVAVLCVLVTNMGGNAGGAVWGLLALTAGMAITAWRRGRLGGWVEGITRDGREWRTSPEGAWRLLAALLVIGLGYLLLGVVRYAEHEELVLARKLAENASLSFDNVTHKLGEPPTYLYAPWAFLQAIVSRGTGLDVLVVHLKLWSVTSGLALLAHYALARTLTGSAVLAGGYLAALTIVAGSSPESWSHDIGALLPFNNRHGVAPGVLLPWGWYLLARVLRGEGWRGVALSACFVFAMALVHARDAIQLLLTAGGAGAALVLFGAVDRPRLARLGALLLGAGLLLGLFKLHHESRVGHVRKVVASVRDALGEETLRLLHHPGEAFLVSGREPHRIRTWVGEYTLGHFPLIYKGMVGHSVMQYCLLAGIGGALWGIFRRRWDSAFVWGIWVVPLVFLNVPIFHTAAGYLTGTTDLEAMTAILGQAAILNTFLVGAVGWSWGIRRIEEAKWGKISPLARWGMALAVALLARELLVRIVRRILPALPSTLDLFVWLTLAAAGLGIAAGIFLARTKDPTGSPGPMVRLPVPAIAGLLVMIWLWFPPMNPRGPSLPALAGTYAAHRQIRSVEDHYDTIRTLPNLATALPREIILHVRRAIGPQHVFAADPREAIPLALYTDSYVAFAGVRLSTEEDYFRLRDRIGGDPLFTDRDLMEQERAIHWYLSRFRVEYLLASPRYAARLNADLPKLNRRGPLFTRVFEADGYVIWKVAGEFLDRTVRLEELGPPQGGTVPKGEHSE